MEQINFIFGIHNHQPTGNFDFVFESAFNKSYKPFIDTLEKFPEIHITLHFSGCLLEWLEDNKPSYIDRIARLVENGNVEILSGGFFEPVLAMLPDRDKIIQIEKLNHYIEKRFGYKPRGLWLTERVWEPGLAKPIAQAGIKYVTVDDYHFLGAGMQQEELDGAFITEEQGYPLWIYPINQNLRYTIPFEDPQDSIDYLRKYVSEDENKCIVMADDGEKFGVWPGTHDIVFKENWLEEFFTALQENQDWLKTKTFAEYYDNHAPKGRIYLPTASYFEMSEWSLPAEAGQKFEEYVEKFEEEGTFADIKPFFKGGMWRNFQYIYDESNWMQKKYLHLSNKLEEIREKKPELEDNDRFQKAREHVLRGTCNCAYWHGLFGGLYLPHLRHAIYSELIKAERIIDQELDEKKFRMEITDLDRDGRDEILVTNTAQELFFAVRPHDGGYIEEFDLTDKSYNVLNTLRRYKEGYHNKVKKATTEANQGASIHDSIRAKEEGLEKLLNYDNQPRKTLHDHFISRSVTLEQFQKGNYFEESDFLEADYDYEIDKRRRSILMKRDGWVNWQPFRVEKHIKFTRSKIIVTYRLENKGQDNNSFRFGPEFNFAMLGGDSPDRYYQSDQVELEKSALNSSAVEPDINSMAVVNEYDKFKIIVKSHFSAEFFRFPIETVSHSEDGFERVYQSSVIVPFIFLEFQPGEQKELKFELEVKRL
ncbi:MAG TPA: alpha-amylase/4-alpha-glucanotransferase domain-containing protein [bacterium]|nr:alpha-amylase/4-alpha-glucanotransferase domain-containing protein [bacterium]